MSTNDPLGLMMLCIPDQHGLLSTITIKRLFFDVKELNLGKEKTLCIIDYLQEFLSTSFNNQS